MSHSFQTRLFFGATTTGDGAVFELATTTRALALQAEIIGAPATCTINLMGLLDGSTFDTIAVFDVTQGYVSGEIQDIPLPAPLRQVKGNISALSPGGSVNLYLAGYM